MVLMVVTWALIGLIVGASSYVLIPWALAALGGIEMRDKIGRYYIKQMQTVLGDSAPREAVHRGRVGIRSEGARLDFEISETPAVPDLRKTHRILAGNARRRYGVLSESWAQKSQEKFGRRISIGQTLILIAAFGLGSGMAILAMRYGTGGGGGGGGTTLPIQIAVGALLL